MQLTPTAAGAFFGIDGLGAVVHPQDEGSRGTEFDAEPTTFTPVLKNVNLAPGPTPLWGTRFYVSSHRSREWTSSHCSSSNIELGELWVHKNNKRKQRSCQEGRRTDDRRQVLCERRRRTLIALTLDAVTFLLGWEAGLAAGLPRARCLALPQVGRQRGPAIPGPKGRASCDRRGPGGGRNRKSSGPPRGR